MSDQGLTARQAQTLGVIRQAIEMGGLSPTVREIAQALEVRSMSSVHTLLRGLRDRGRIAWTTGAKRSIVLLGERRAGHVLRPDLQARLERYCRAHDEEPGDVLHDALTLHLDIVEEDERSVSRETEAGP